MNIRLTFAQRDMLMEVKSRFKWESNLNFENQPTCVILKDISEDDAIDLRELCSDYLLEVGFDENYAPDEKGTLLENLVDKLYVE